MTEQGVGETGHHPHRCPLAATKGWRAISHPSTVLARERIAEVGKYPGTAHWRRLACCPRRTCKGPATCSPEPLEGGRFAGVAASGPHAAGPGLPAIRRERLLREACSECDDTGSASSTAWR